MKILLRNGNQKNWKLVNSFSYDNETELQKLLAESPNLIPAQDMREGSGQLIAVVREVNLDIGYVDFLGFSAEGEIAVIECKLANNPEVKRIVIGQVLEYGAALWGMSYEEFDQKIHDRMGKPLAELVQDEVGDPEWDEELFRSNVQENLKTGNFILVIVVDEINDALTRIIRFLNACGSPNFSFAALEMRRFQSGGVEILLPKVDGDYRPPSQRASGSQKTWNKESLLADAKEKLNPKAFDMLKDLLTFAETHAPGGVGFGSGKKDGSFTYYCVRDNQRASVFSVYSNGDFSINLGAMPKIFADHEIAEFKNDLDKIPPLQGIIASAKYWNVYKLGRDITEHLHLEMFKECVTSLYDKPE